MLTEHQEEWTIISQPEPVEEPVYFSTKSICKLRRKCFSLFLLIFTSAMLIVAQSDQLVINSYKLVGMKEQAAELEMENQSIRIDIAKLKSSERIADIATHQLGLVLPDAKDMNTFL